LAVSTPIVIRKAPGDRKRDDLANDLQRQLTTRLLKAVPVAVKASQAAPTGSLRMLELGEDGDSTEDLVLSTGGTYAIPHGLGRAIVGRLIVYQTANGFLRDVDPESLSPALDPTKFFCVTTSLNCTYRVLVF
jgi:hypothetical protein